MKCATCERPCSEAGHLKGNKEVKRDKNAITFECLRCGMYLEQPVCECCGVALGALAVSAKDTAEAAAKRKGKAK